MIMSARALALFLGSLVVATWALQIVGLATVSDVDSPAMTPFFIGAMFMPTVWSVGYLTLFNRKAWKLVRFWPGNPIYLLLGALIPAATALAVLAISLQQGWGGSSYFDFNANGATVLRGPWLLGDGAQSWAMFVANIAATGVAFAALNSVATVGEEFGWRGVVQHHIIERLGFVRGVALLGFVWAIWHAPMNLAGYNYPEAPVLGAFVLFPLLLIPESFIMAWLTIRAKSFWPAVLMHGAVNGIGDGVMSSLTMREGVAPLTPDFVMIGITWAIALACIALTLGDRARRLDLMAVA